MNSILKTSPLVALLMTATIVLASCGAPLPKTDILSASGPVSSMVRTEAGGIRYVDRSNGEIRELDKAGKPAQTVGTVPVADNDHWTLPSITVGDNDKTYAAWTSGTTTLTVAQVTEPRRIIWTTQVQPSSSVQLAFTPTKRLLVAIGGSGNDKSGRIVTLDPTQGLNQQPNVIATGLHSPISPVYFHDLLWVADVIDGKALIGRVGENGFIGNTDELALGKEPGGMGLFGDRELLVCSRDSKDLQRYLFKEVDVVDGRKVAKDCTGPAAELGEGRIAYAAAGGIRATH